MENAVDNIRRGLLKREKALENYLGGKSAFLLDKEKIINEIEEARTIWKDALERLPEQEFKF